MTPLHACRASALAALASLATMGAPSEAQAQSADGRTGVVLRFTGSRGNQARRQVVSAADDRLQLVERREVEGRARDLGADLSDGPGIASVAREMGLTLVVSGRVRGRGSRGRTVIRVHDALGNEVAMREGPAPVGRARQNRIRRAAAEAIDQALGAIAEREAQEAAEREAAERAAAEAAERERLARLELEGEDDDDDDDDTVEDGLPRFVGLIGFDGRTRDASVDLADGGGRDYDAGVFGSLTLQLSSFPLGNRPGAERGLYAQVDFGVSMGLKSQEALPDGSFGPVLSTQSLQFALHVGYLYPVGDDDARLGALVGFGVDSFSIDENGSMPSSKYTFLRVGIAGDVRIYEDLLRARVDLGYRITFGGGDLVPTFGEDASVGGFDLGLALLSTLEMGVVIGARFGFTRYGTDFTGLGGDPAVHPASVDAETMTDKSLNFGVQVGYQLR